MLIFEMLLHHIQKRVHIVMYTANTNICIFAMNIAIQMNFVILLLLLFTRLASQLFV